MLLDHRSLTPAELRDIWQTDPRIAAGMVSMVFGQSDLSGAP
jgi:hypothetical protein